MLKKRGAALLIDLFIFFLFNSIVIRPYLEAEVSVDNLQGLIASFTGYFTVYFLIAFFGRASPGGLLVGISFVKDDSQPWLLSFLKRHSYALILFVLMTTLLLRILPEASVLSENSNGTHLGEIIYSFSAIKAVGWAFFILFLVDLVRAVASKSQQTFTETWARIHYEG